MKLYLAGVIMNMPMGERLELLLTEAERVARTTPRWYLESYHYMNRKKDADLIRREGRGVKVFLDSGAFSSFTLGKVIDLNRYCDFIQENADVIQVASVLDGIGDPELTLINQNLMQEQLPRDQWPLPCFHYGEDKTAAGRQMLIDYVANYEYITLGGMVPISTPQLHIWLDRIWEQYLLHPDGSPKIKVHAFGMTSLPLMVKYPWYSVDSSSWVQQGKVGMAVVDLGGERPIIVQLSSTSESLKMDRKHYATETDSFRATLLAKFSEDGFDPKRMGEEYYSRWVYNMLTYYRMGERTPDHGFFNNQNTLGIF